MKRIACLLVLASFPSLFSAAQKIEAALNELSLKHPSEKIYIHYDKDYYAAGETAWFKAYLYNNGQPSELNYNFYIQLSDNRGTIISTQKYPVKGATVSGNIDLPDSLPGGTYFVRALTPSMLNEDPAFQYFKPIFVFNPAAEAAAASGSLSLRFFPEGGVLTEEILCVVAFKSADASGRPVDISGLIKTDDTVTVTSFKSMHDVIGKFQYRPRPGKKYTAAVTVNGLTSYYPLPEATPSGIGVKVENEPGGRVFTISRSRKDKEQFAKLRLLAQMNNRIIYDTEIEFDNFYQVKGHLITDSMPSGILHFTVFNNDGLPLAERLSFVDNREYESKGQVEVIKQGTGKREENSIDIIFADTVQRSLSVSVTDISASGFAGKNNIISSLLLTSDLRGMIHNPAWYFQKNNDTTVQQALDNLMLTHGWSRFSWKKILAGEFPDKKINDQYLIAVPGLVQDSKTKAPVRGGQLSLFLEPADSVSQHFDIPVDNNGRFTIDSLLIRGKTKIYYGYTNPQGTEKPADITLYSIPADSAIAALEINKRAAEEIAGLYTGLYSNKEITVTAPVKKSKLDETKVLDPVVLKPKEYKRPIDEVNAKYTSGVFTSMGRVNIDNINDPENDRSLSVYDFTKRSVKQVIEEDGQFVNRRNFDLFNAPTTVQDFNAQKTKDSSRAAEGGSPGSQDTYYKIDYSKGKHFAIGIYLNESPAYVGILKTIRMDEVALIKFYEPGFIGSGATESPGGVLSVYTKKMETPKGELEKLDHVSYNGYALVKEFYSPDYATAAPGSTLPDNRTTLFWNPELYTGSKNNRIHLEFFNNDISKRFKVIIEGFESTGKLIHLEKIIGD
jgi:hypothetical protein